MIVAIVLPKQEQNHLVNLLLGRTDDYHGGAVMRTELRHLASLELIRRRPNHSIEEMRSNKAFNLKDYVQLTEIGTRAAQTIGAARAAGEEHESTED